MCAVSCSYPPVHFFHTTLNTQCWSCGSGAALLFVSESAIQYASVRDLYLRAADLYCTEYRKSSLCLVHRELVKSHKRVFMRASFMRKCASEKAVRLTKMFHHIFFSFGLQKATFWQTRTLCTNKISRCFCHKTTVNWQPLATTFFCSILIQRLCLSIIERIQRFLIRAEGSDEVTSQHKKQL